MDGLDAYGLTCTTGGGIPDIENHEGADPVLFLWRRLIPNSGGPGQMRGGQALDQAYAVHYSDMMAGPGFNACAQVPPHGVGGGYPANAGIFYPVRNGNIQELLDKGVLPTYERFEGEREDVRSKLGHIKLDHDTVFVALFPSLVMLIGSTILMTWYWPMMGLLVGAGSVLFIAFTATATPTHRPVTGS